MARTAKKKISIFDDGAVLVEDVDSIDFAGAGVTGTNVNNAVTETIPGGGGGGSWKTPTGTVNGSNVTFTTGTDVPVLVATEQGIAVNGFGCTIVGNTITMFLAPQDFIRYST
jgi:hypothetical protein